MWKSWCPFCGYNNTDSNCIKDVNKCINYFYYIVNTNCCINLDENAKYY